MNCAFKYFLFAGFFIGFLFTSPAFREDATCPAMQNAEGLRSAGVDGQTAFQEIGAKLGEFKSQMRGHVRVTNGFEGVKRVVFEPDHFYFFPVF